jgi:hypothetical protein
MMVQTLVDTSEKELTNLQLRAVNFLIAGKSWNKTAELVPCGIASLKRWHSAPEPNPFKAAIADGKRQAFQAAVGMLSAGCTVAVETLVSIAENPDAADSVRVRASEVILSNSIKVVEMGELQKRIEDLEAMLNDSHIQN